MLKRELTFYNIEIVNITSGHYYLSGFLKKDDVFIYINFNIPRGNCRTVDFQSKCFSDKVLYRYANEDSGEKNELLSYIADFGLVSSSLSRIPAVSCIAVVGGLKILHTVIHIWNFCTWQIEAGS